MWPYFVVPVAIGLALFLTWRIVNEPRGSEGSPTALLGADRNPPALIEDGGQPLSIDEGDRNLKELAAGWSADPLFGRWLDLISLRHLVAAAQLVADGDSVKPALPFLSIAGPFAVREERPKPAQERLFIAPASYARYDVLARVAGSVNAAAAGAVYGRLKPFCESAFAEIGRPGKSLDEVLASAVRRVTQVQLLEGEVALVPKGAVYAFKDPELERLSAAEKQILRMGPKNGAVLQRQLRAFAEGAGLNISPAER